MGIELELLIPSVPYDLYQKVEIFFERLKFATDYEIFKQIEGFSGSSQETLVVTTERIPFTLSVMICDENIGSIRIDEDKYGVVLKFTTAKEMRKIELPEDTNKKNKAIKAFIDELWDDTPIILRWC